jgi:NAD(P)-dependent dehydrogenase (short-subunit alcohol dehydrogenase family)
MKIDLTDRVAVVTGGSRGIGRAICSLLAKSGAKVVINFNRSEEKAGEVNKEINEAGGHAEVFKADISIPEEVNALFDFVRDTYSQIDILVNNAGVIKDNITGKL